jgi:hypothetical protein
MCNAFVTRGALCCIVDFNRNFDEIRDMPEGKEKIICRENKIHENKS